MGRLSELDSERQLLRSFELEELVSAVLNEPDSAEVQLERKIDSIIRDLDEICALASNPETVDLVEREQIGVGQMLTRTQLIAEFLLCRKPRLTVVSKRHG